MWKKNQRVLSRLEPELGVGCISLINEELGQLEIKFSAANILRRYSTNNPPLYRFRFGIGDKFLAQDGQLRTVRGVRDLDGYLKYSAEEGSEFWEYEIEGSVSELGEAKELLLAGKWSHPRAYNLRRDGWEVQRKVKSSAAHGLAAARVNPLPHQLYIAREVSRRMKPRVLLSDEVGLGKTIEAGLIFSALKALGRAERVLVITPESLVHQWMAEFFRRFGELFSVINEDRLEEEGVQRAFAETQRAICSIDLLLGDELCQEAAIGAGWDLIIVDEAHHLNWDAENPSAKWLLLKKLSMISDGLLLLTATPRHHGPANWFGLLNLVDSDRFDDFEIFALEFENMQRVAALARALVNETLDDDDVELLRSLVPQTEEWKLRLTTPAKIAAERDTIVRYLIDQHGTGRVIFRNRRANIPGFPRRNLLSVPLKPSASYIKFLAGIDAKTESQKNIIGMGTGCPVKRGFSDKAADNPKYRWLREYLSTVKSEKILIVCSNAKTVLEVRDVVGTLIPAAIFHENLSTVERDREAARFASVKSSAALIVSEIGGEGRNFQFANTIILLDLPAIPDLLEQRIGRIDRIGQGNSINVIVPWLEDTPEEVLFRWYDQGLNSFCDFWNGADRVLEELSDELIESLRSFLPASSDFPMRQKILDALLGAAKTVSADLRSDQEQSSDVLLDLNSFNEEAGNIIVEAIEDLDDDASVELFIQDLFEHYGVSYDEIDSHGSIAVRTDTLSFVDDIPGLDKEVDLSLTFDRATALQREDMLFLTGEHPLLQGFLNFLQVRGEGAASVCRWRNSGLPRGVIVELSAVLEATGHPILNLARYLPVQTREFRLNSERKLIKGALAYERDPGLLEPEAFSPEKWERSRLAAIIDSYVEAINAELILWRDKAVESALEEAKSDLQQEFDRLQELAMVNPQVSTAEIEWMRNHKEQTLQALAKARTRLDGIRLIFT